MKTRQTLIGLIIGCGLALLGVFTACKPPSQPPEQRAQAAKALFEQTLREFHLPSADTNEFEKARLLTQAARGYEKLLREYPEQSNLCAQAWRSLGNIRATQNNVAEAVRDFSTVAERYPGEDWEILQAWKSAADLLWDAGKTDEAQRFYSRIVTRFDSSNATSVVKLVVRGARSRLAK